MINGRDSEYMCNFGKGGICAIQHTFWQKVAAGHKEQMSPLMI